MGRPKKKIDPKLVQKLAEMGCTLEEIAAFPGIDCNKSTISRRFATEIDKGRPKTIRAAGKSRFPCTRSRLIT